MNDTANIVMPESAEPEIGAAVRLHRFVRPYYVDSHCTIFNADCRELLDAIECDCVLTDPPYGINGGRGSKSTERGRGNYTTDFDDTPEYIREVVADVIRRCVVEITAEDPRQPMVDTFGAKWSMQYDEMPPETLRHFPRGIIKLKT